MRGGRRRVAPAVDRIPIARQGGFEPRSPVRRRRSPPRHYKVFGHFDPTKPAGPGNQPRQYMFRGEENMSRTPSPESRARTPSTVSSQAGPAKRQKGRIFFDDLQNFWLKNRIFLILYD